MKGAGLARSAVPPCAQQRISQSPWVVMDLKLYSIRCETCKAEAAAALPLRIFAWIHQAARFVRRHKDCGDPGRARRYDAKKKLETLAMTLPPADRDELLKRIEEMGQAKAGEAAFHASLAGRMGGTEVSTVHGAGQFEVVPPLRAHDYEAGL